MGDNDVIEAIIPGGKTPAGRYPADGIADTLISAGWTGTARDGWLFWAHSTAEGAGAGPLSVAAELQHRLSLPKTADLTPVGTVIYADFVTCGARHRKDLKTMEVLITELVKVKVRQRGEAH